MLSTNEKKFTFMGIYNILIYLPYGVLTPFLAIWLHSYLIEGTSWAQDVSYYGIKFFESIGISSDVAVSIASGLPLSVIISIAFIGSFFIDPIVGYLCDKTKNYRLILSSLALTSLLCFSMLALTKKFFIPTLVAFSAFRILWIAIIPPTDNLAVDITSKLKNGKFLYFKSWGVIRSLGSVSFLAAAMITSAVATDEFGRFSDNWQNDAYLLVCLFSTLLFVGSLFLPTSKDNNSRLVESKDANKEEVSRLEILFSSPVIILSCIGYFFISKSFAQELFMSSFRYAVELNFSPKQITNIWIVRVLSEVIVFLFIGYLFNKGFKNYGKIIILGSVLGIIRWIGLAYATDLWKIIFIESLHGFNYGAVMIALIYWIRSITDKDWHNVAISLLSGTSALGYGIGALFSGVIWYSFKAKGWLIEAGFATLGTVFMIIALILTTSKNKATKSA